MNKKWGTYPWFMERGIELIHPDDLESFKKEANNCKVFECIEESDYLTLNYNDKHYRVKDKLFKPIPSPKYTFGQHIIINGEDARITDIMWHSSNKEHYYLVSIANKKKSKRYFESDLD